MTVAVAQRLHWQPEIGHEIERFRSSLYAKPSHQMMRWSAMPLYRFVISDGSQSTDLIDLPDMSAARREATRVVSKLVGSEPEELWREGALRLSVQNYDGLILFEIDIVATNAPIQIRPMPI